MIWFLKNLLTFPMSIFKDCYLFLIFLNLKIHNKNAYILSRALILSLRIIRLCHDSGQSVPRIFSPQSNLPTTMSRTG